MSNRSGSLLSSFIAAAAERLSMHPCIPPENREAFRASVVSVLEQLVVGMFGGITVRMTGWVVAPSLRQDRRDRIESALLAGESVRAIAGRELVSERYVRKLAAWLREQDSCGTKGP